MVSLLFLFVLAVVSALPVGLLFYFLFRDQK
jgi:hypothetical protein